MQNDVTNTLCEIRVLRCYRAKRAQLDTFRVLYLEAKARIRP